MSRVIRLRWSGFVYIIITIVLGILAVNSGNNLLYLVTAVLLGYMLSSGVVGRRNIFAVSVTVEFPNEIFAKIPCSATIKITNNNRFAPIFLIKIESENGAFFPVVPPKSTVEKNMNFTFSDSGEQCISELEFSSVYPFNFFTRYWQSDFEKRIIVSPTPLKDKDKNEEKDNSMPSDSDVVGVRPYKEGDQMKHIHWKSSARTGKLKTRLYEVENASVRIIDLDELVDSDTDTDNKISLKKLLDISAALSAAMSLLMAIGYVRPIYSVGFVLVIAASFFVRVYMNIAAVGILAATFAGLRRNNIFEIMMEAILIMLAAKITDRKTSRDYPQIALLSLMMLVCFSMLSIDKSFLFFCFGIGLLSSFMLILSSWLSKEPESMLSFSEIRQIIMRALGVSGLMLPVCVIIFFSAPRVGSPFFGVRSTDDGVTGFSEQVQLGDVSQIQKSGKLAFRAVMERQKFSNLYWRGIVLDVFDGNSWSMRGRRISISKPQLNTQTINQEIILEPGKHRYLFALDMPLSVSGKIRANVRGDGVITYDGMQDGKRISYYAVSAIPEPGAMKSQIERVRDYMRLPEDFSPRLRELTDEITSGKDHSGKIDAILEFFSSPRFGYALSGLVRSSNALEDFIFGSGKGSCEYFASAMGVMLRMAEIPARLVGGYAGGIYNDSGGYYSIFEEQAHVWVEAWDDAQNEWVRYDPTPPAVGDQARALEYGFWEKYVDLLDYRWTNFVINYNLETQRDMIREIMEGVKNPNSFINSPWFGDVDRPFFIWLAVITGVVLSLFVFFKRAGDSKKEIPTILQKFLRIMKKRGYDKKPGEGLEEFLSAMDSETREKTAPFVRHFQEIYFKDMPMDKEIKILLKKLRFWSSRFPRPRTSKSTKIRDDDTRRSGG